MTTLVTGAFGCIGAWVTRGLLAAGERPVLIHLAAWQVPLCRQDPPRGASINARELT
jgi:nucleoside-diphosphate-sugar epimerase